MGTERRVNTMEIKLRPYQQECVNIINKIEKGGHLVAMATGLGKTVIFSQLERRGRTLILSHRDELVHQPQKYFDCSFGVEQAAEHSDGEEVISASVQSLVRRLPSFSPDDFDMIITDEAHHAAATSYKTIYSYFKPRVHIGFTATPKRGDKARLNDVFEDIVYYRDLRWGIENGYLSDINCLRAELGFDLSNVKKKNGDFDTKQLSQSVNRSELNQAVACAYRELAVGQTLIFAADIAHAYALSELIKGSVVVSGKTPSEDRKKIIKAFTDREIPCIINCMVFTEGTDMPLIETIIVARPTMNASLYTQMVGRGLRLYEGKKYLTLIDCVGASGQHKLCTAPTLLGLDYSAVPRKKQKKVTGMLSQMQDIIEALIDQTPKAWILNVQKISLWAEESDIDLRGINWKQGCDGSLFCNVGGNSRIVVEAADNLGRTSVNKVTSRYAMRDVTESIAENVLIQGAIDKAYEYLTNNYNSSKMLWDTKSAMLWGKKPITEKQINIIKRMSRYSIYDFAEFEPERLSRFEASIVIDKLMGN